MAALEPASQITWEIEDQGNVSGAGWMHVISGLRTLLEPGEPLDPPA